jgi:uncharacterized protein YecE (DUF72 family)
VERARRLRAEAPEGFIYSIKAWQVITHSPTSPTMKRLRRKLEGDLSEYGFLRPTRANMVAWEVVYSFARELGARFVIFQTPPSFGYSPEALKWVRDFFSSIVGRGFEIGWEPRGSWNDPSNLGALCSLLTELKILHVVDLLRRDPCRSVENKVYTRLHGLGGGEVNYRYRYTDQDLRELMERIERPGFSEAYVLFNNVYMWDDAKRFKSLVSK